MKEGLQLLVGYLEPLVCVLKVFACALDPSPATHEYPDDPKEHQAHGDAVGEHEGGQLALCSLLKPGQRSEVQAPLVSGNFDVAHFGEEGLVPSLPGAFYAVAIIEQRAQRRARAVVDLEIYGRVERSLEDPIEKHVAYDGTNDESLKHAPTFGDGPQRLVLLVDRKVHDEATFQGKVSAMARGSLGKHVNHLRSLRLTGVPRLVHGLPVRRIGVEVVVEPFLISGVEGTGVSYGEIHSAFATGNQVGVKGRLALPLRPSREGFPLTWFHTLGIAEGLQAIITFVRLYALHVGVPLLASHRAASVEEPAGTKHRIEVGFGAPLYSLLSELGCLIEAEVVLCLYVLAHVVIGKSRKEERDEQHPVGCYAAA